MLYIYNGFSDFTYQYYFAYLSKVVGYDNTAWSWHHFEYAIDKIKGKDYVFLDGVLKSSINTNSKPVAFTFDSCCRDTYNSSTYLNKAFQIAQVAVWDNVRHTSDFDVPRKPYI